MTGGGEEEAGSGEEEAGGVDEEVGREEGDSKEGTTDGGGRDVGTGTECSVTVAIWSSE